FMHSSLIENINYEHFAFAAPNDAVNWGTTFSYLGYGDIAGYTDAATGQTPQATGNVSAYSFVWNTGLARQINPRLALGLGGELIHETLGSDSASTVALNAGSLYTPLAHPFDTNYRLGFSILNLGPGLKFVSDRDPLPRKIKFGLAATD